MLYKKCTKFHSFHYKQCYVDDSQLKAFKAKNSTAKQLAHL